MLDEVEDYEAVIDDLSRHIGSGLPAGAALHNRAVAHWEIGQHEKALEDFDLAMAALPRSHMPPSIKGAMLAKLGRFQEALSMFDLAITLAPDEVTLVRAWARARMEGGLLREALEDLEHAVRLQPGFKYTRDERDRLASQLGVPVGEAGTPAPAVTIGDVMRAYARETEELVVARTGQRPDYSEASLLLVDVLLADRLANGLIIAQRCTPQEDAELWTFCKRIGGYLGEVIIRNLGGEWSVRQQAGGDASIQLSVRNVIEAQPADSIWRCLTEPDRGSVSGLYTTLMAALSLSRGEAEVVQGIKTVRPGPLSAIAPGGQEPEGRKPDGASRGRRAWWKFW